MAKHRRVALFSCLKVIHSSAVGGNGALVCSMPIDASMNCQKLLDGFAGKKIIVLGDVILDEFIWGKVRRISPEAPVPVVEVLDETYRMGGSANVAANIRGLEGTPIPIG